MESIRDVFRYFEQMPMGGQNKVGCSFAGGVWGTSPLPPRAARTIPPCHQLVQIALVFSHTAAAALRMLPQEMRYDLVAETQTHLEQAVGLFDDKTLFLVCVPVRMRVVSVFVSCVFCSRVFLCPSMCEHIHLPI